MRIALFADIHANLEALDACLRHANQQGVERFAILGDVVGYGADPGPVTDRVHALVDSGALAVKGNHDEALERTDAALTDEASQVIDWTRTRLSPDQRSFLATLPMVAQEDDAFFVHASADVPSSGSRVPVGRHRGGPA